jgi:hypothetical protein
VVEAVDPRIQPEVDCIWSLSPMELPAIMHSGYEVIHLLMEEKRNGLFQFLTRNVCEIDSFCAKSLQIRFWQSKIKVECLVNFPPIKFD